MDIKTIADLAKLADTCRKKGIESIKIGADGIEFRLGEKPTQKRTVSQSAGSDSIQEDKSYSEEDFLNWSSAGV